MPFIVTNCDMGAPDLPDPGEDQDLRPPEPIQHPAIVSDESDNESLDAYDGYQPLAIEETEELTSANTNAMESSVELDPHFPNLTPIERIDSEISRQVWNAPRPEGNQIVLDTTRTEQILNAMANFSLPNDTIPEWAINVPEERWKEELLQRIRHSKEVQEKRGSNDLQD